MGREYELKYMAEPEQLNAVEESYGEFHRICMETVYYDGPDGSFGALRWTLRRRLENELSVCTLKTTASDGARGEWEVQCPDIEQAVSLLVQEGAPAQIAEMAAHGLVPTCGARFTRLAKLLEVPGGTVELALDRGVLLGGNRELPFAEIEVELKSGPDKAADDFAEALAGRFCLKPQTLSKFRRALALADQK